MDSRQIIFQSEQHIQTLHDAKLVKMQQWSGDVDVARGWDLRIPRRTVRRRPVLVSWCPPSTSQFKLNVDGASKRSLQLAEGGGLLRNSKGVVLAAFSSSYDFCTAIVAKMRALEDGLRMCINFGVTNVQVKIDSMVLQLMLRRGKVNWRLLHLFMVVNGMLSNLQAQVCHVYREANQAADWLANHACSSLRNDRYTASNLHRPLKVIVARDAQREVFLRC